MNIKKYLVVLPLITSCNGLGKSHILPQEWGNKRAGASSQDNSIKHGFNLHAAIEINNLFLVEQACLRGANIDERNLKGQTPLDRAQEIGNLEIVNFLLSEVEERIVRIVDTFNSTFKTQKDEYHPLTMRVLTKLLLKHANEIHEDFFKEGDYELYTPFSLVLYSRSDSAILGFLDHVKKYNIKIYSHYWINYRSIAHGTGGSLYEFILKNCSQKIMSRLHQDEDEPYLKHVANITEGEWNKAMINTLRRINSSQVEEHLKGHPTKRLISRIIEAGHTQALVSQINTGNIDKELLEGKRDLARYTGTKEKYPINYVLTDIIKRYKYLAYESCTENKELQSLKDLVKILVSRDADIINDKYSTLNIFTEMKKYNLLPNLKDYGKICKNQKKEIHTLLNIVRDHKDYQKLVSVAKELSEYLDDSKDGIEQEQKV